MNENSHLEQAPEMLTHYDAAKASADQSARVGEREELEEARDAWAAYYDSLCDHSDAARPHRMAVAAMVNFLDAVRGPH